jgi:hypothetical protein
VAVVSPIRLAIFGLTMIGTVRSAICGAVRNADPTHAMSQVNAAVDVTIALTTVGGLIRIGLGPWLPRLSSWTSTLRPWTSRP